MVACTASQNAGPGPLGGSLVDVLIEAMSGQDAKADNPAITIGNTLDVATETCTLRVPGDIPGLVWMYAVHAYPGFAAAQLSQVRTIGHLTDRDQSYPST